MKTQRPIRSECRKSRRPESMKSKMLIKCVLACLCLCISTNGYGQEKIELSKDLLHSISVYISASATTILYETNLNVGLATEFYVAASEGEDSQRAREIFDTTLAETKRQLDAQIAFLGDVVTKSPFTRQHKKLLLYYIQGYKHVLMQIEAMQKILDSGEDKWVDIYDKNRAAVENIMVDIKSGEFRKRNPID